MENEDTKRHKNKRLSMAEGIVINVKNCWCFGITQIGKSFSLGGLIIGPVLLLICCALTYLGNHRLFEIIDFHYKENPTREKEYEMSSKMPETKGESHNKTQENLNKEEEAKKILTDVKKDSTTHQKPMEIKFKMPLSSPQLPETPAEASEFAIDPKIEDTSFCRVVRRRMGIVFWIITVLLVLIEQLTVIFFQIIFASEFWADSIFYNSKYTGSDKNAQKSRMSHWNIILMLAILIPNNLLSSHRPKQLQKISLIGNIIVLCSIFISACGAVIQFQKPENADQINANRDLLLAPGKGRFADFVALFSRCVFIAFTCNICVELRNWTIGKGKIDEKKHGYLLQGISIGVIYSGLFIYGQIMANTYPTPILRETALFPQANWETDWIAKMLAFAYGFVFCVSIQIQLIPVQELVNEAMVVPDYWSEIKPDEKLKKILWIIGHALLPLILVLIGFGNFGNLNVWIDYTSGIGASFFQFMIPCILQHYFLKKNGVLDILATIVMVLFGLFGIATIYLKLAI